MEPVPRADAAAEEAGAAPAGAAAAAGPSAEVQAAPVPDAMSGEATWLARREQWLRPRAAAKDGAPQRAPALNWLELSSAERYNLRSCLSSVEQPYPPLSRRLPLRVAVRCADELWSSGGAGGPGAVEQLAEAARVASQELAKKSAALGSTLARPGAPFGVNDGGGG
ncbi:unnamed protein product [Prorocentrum cordatum]|uniref:Uncharacterized protein n=1 Tax=Prorocentrum cordatum TaxID=2364126 RepID=A0ABN9TWX2_9DINO|nr:unnamed protein product [Polarella glacialis]